MQEGFHPLTYLSVCSGIEAASVAWEPLAWQPVGFAEIDKFPSAVLAHHYPGVKNYGDFTKIELKDLPSRPDILVGGTPCQSFSVAGLRAGLADPRGNLTLEFARLAERLRTRWLVWENVPGVLSIDEGRTFGAFLGALGEIGYGFAYRVLDAQYAGVPQQRRRVFLVGHLEDWRRAAAVLFERQSLSRDTPPSREKRESAPTIPSRRTASGGLGTDFDCDGGLVAESAQVAFGGNNTGRPISVATAVNAHGGPKGRLDFESETFVTGVTHSLRGDGFDASEDGTGRGTPLVPVVYRTNAAGQVDNQGPLSAALTSQTDPCTQFIAFNLRGREGGSLPEPAPDNQASMRAASGGSSSSRSYVAQAIGLDEEQNATVDGMGCLKARREGGGFEGTVMTPAMQVRRLTPVECHRLQGFPDDYLDIIYNGKPAADSPKYKALGNSFAVPVVRWIGQRIQLIDLFS
jgi:DNA (cytosine-5)-methyltransferase 1